MPTNTDRPCGGLSGARGTRGLVPRARARALVLVHALLLAFLQPVQDALAGSLWVGTLDVSRPVWIDDEYVGLAPVWIDDLGDGTHSVEVGARPGSTEWTRTWKTRVTLSGEESVRVEVPPLQVLRVLSSGRPVEVALDDEPVGWTPLHLLVRSDRSLELRVGGQAPLLYRATSSTDSTLRVPGPAEPRRAPAAMETSRGSLLLPLGAVAFGVVGAWARQEGDRAYGDYLTTVDRARMRDRYDRAERYDDVAAGCWLVAEALLVVSVWKWLHGSGTESPHVPTSSFTLDMKESGEMRLALSIPFGGTTSEESR